MKLPNHITKLEKKIAEITVKFKAATKAEKRVIIAKDVIAQLKAKTYKAKKGVFITSRTLTKLSKETESQELSVQELLISNKLPDCKVCALGGMMLSCTVHNNNVKVEDSEALWNIGEYIDDNARLPNGLNRIFTKEQLIMIETAFEGGEGYFSFYNSFTDSKRLTASYEFYDKNKRAGQEARLITIMQNIVDNEGTFKP